MKTAIIIKIKELINEVGIPNFHLEEIMEIFLEGGLNDFWEIYGITTDGVQTQHRTYESVDDYNDVMYEDLPDDILGDIFLIMDDYKVSQDKSFNRCKDENY